MSQIEFDELWRDLLRGDYKDGGYENIRQVIRYLSGLPEDSRQAFLKRTRDCGPKQIVRLGYCSWGSSN